MLISATTTFSAVRLLGSNRTTAFRRREIAAAPASLRIRTLDPEPELRPSRQDTRPARNVNRTLCRCGTDLLLLEKLNGGSCAIDLLGRTGQVIVDRLRDLSRHACRHDGSVVLDLIPETRNLVRDRGVYGWTYVGCVGSWGMECVARHRSGPGSSEHGLSPPARSCRAPHSQRQVHPVHLLATCAPSMRAGSPSRTRLPGASSTTA